MDDRFKPVQQNPFYSLDYKIIYLKTEKRRVEKARIEAIERMVIFNKDSCFSTLNLPKSGAFITPLVAAIVRGKKESEIGVSLI